MVLRLNRWSQVTCEARTIGLRKSISSSAWNFFSERFWPEALNFRLSDMLPHLTICICTCGRPQMLDRLLREISRQDAAGAFTFSVVVTDNDAAESARA